MAKGFKCGSGFSESQLDEKLKDLDVNNLELLWKNASPSSSFAEQTVKFSKKTDAKFFLVVFSQMAGSDTNISTEIVSLKAVSTPLNYFVSIGGGTNRFRYVNGVTEEGMTFDFGRNAGQNISQISTADNNSLIPLEIYAIKGVSE